MNFRGAATVQFVSLEAEAAASLDVCARAVARLAAEQDSSGEEIIALLLAESRELWRVAAELDRHAVKYRAHGGALFVGHAVVRQLLLAVCAVADRDDGVAEAAVMAAPFFAIDVADVATALVQKDAGGDVRRRRVSEARDLLAELRRRRHRLTPGAVARELIERTAFAHALDTAPNGAQHREAIAVVISWLDAVAWREKLEFDSVAARVRRHIDSPEWIHVPVSLTPGVLQILPMHAADAVECDRAILCSFGTDAVTLPAWSCSVAADDALVVSFGNDPAKVRVRRRLVVPVAGDKQAACADVKRRWQDVAATRFTSE